MTRKPLDDLRVRQAIAHAVDTKVWLAAYGDFVEPMYGVSPVGAYGALTKARPAGGLAVRLQSRN